MRGDVSKVKQNASLMYFFVQFERALSASRAPMLKAGPYIAFRANNLSHNNFIPMYALRHTGLYSCDVSERSCFKPCIIERFLNPSYTMCIVPLWATPEHLKRLNPLYAPRNKWLAAPEVDLSRTFREVATWSHNVLHAPLEFVVHTFVTRVPKTFHG